MPWGRSVRTPRRRCRALVNALKDARTCGAAFDSLGQIGAKAQSAVPALEQVLKGEENLRWAAAAALVRIGGPGARPGVSCVFAARRSALLPQRGPHRFASR